MKVLIDIHLILSQVSEKYAKEKINIVNESAFLYVYDQMLLQLMLIDRISKINYFHAWRRDKIVACVSITQTIHDL